MPEDSLLNLPKILSICPEKSIYEELPGKINVSSEIGLSMTEHESLNFQRSGELNRVSLFQLGSQKYLSPKTNNSGPLNAATGLLDLDKYLKRQAELAAKRKQNFTNLTKSTDSDQGKTANDQVSRKSRSTHQSEVNSPRVDSTHKHRRFPGKSKCIVGSSSGSEYTPSSDESIYSEYSPRVSKRKRKQKRSLDDGDESQYQCRLAKVPKTSIDPSATSLRTVSNLYKVPRSLWKRLYPYQRVSLHWLWELHNRNLGGLLGDEMGLGKTVQIIAFLAGLDASELLSDGGRFRGLGPTLIVCPATLLEQWVNQFHKWYPSIRVAIMHQSGSYKGSSSTLLNSLETGGILLTSYAGVIRNSDLLIPYKWHYIILDEGHKIRNPSAKITKLLKKINTPHRLLLTGSPMQNSLKELWSLFDFILPGKLGTLDAFMEHCATPITKGGYSSASSLQEATALQVATMLKNAITPYMLRRTKIDVQTHLNLPKKTEQVLFCSLTRKQIEIYKKYLISENVKKIIHERVSNHGQQRATILVALTALRKICNHPDLFTHSNSDIVSEEFENGEEEDDLGDENFAIERFGNWKKSGKMIVVRSLLKMWKKQGHRALLFTQGRQMLHILEALIQREGYKYLRLDGTTPMSERQKSIKLFNSDESYFIFLSTTRVGGLGVNLIGANRVIIYDPDWNPATDVQARERAWRIGQNKNVTIYRLMTAGTIEEKIYHRQIFKLLLSNKVLDDPKQRRLFRISDLSELFHLNEPIDGNSTESDRLFGNSVIKKKLKGNGTGKKAGQVSAMFEGERVSHLVGRRLEKSWETSASSHINDDNYVLNKLFAKNCVNSAMAHDTVLSTARLDEHMTTPMYRLAKETAQESMDFVKQSRKFCWKPLWESSVHKNK